MQQLMTLEIDIILGNTKNTMKHLGKNTNDEDEDDKNKAADGGMKQKLKFDLDFPNVDLSTVESNQGKINILERTMNNFFKIFMSKQ